MAGPGFRGGREGYLRRVKIGYHLSSEELHPAVMPKLAGRAEQAGFDFLTVSDHYHPWTHRQGQSPFVWSALGAIAVATDEIEVMTAVTCPTVRIHPAVVAQAAATTAAMMPGRFSLGVGTGEALNEHILGDRWPSSGVRRDMLREAVGVIRLLWQGGSQSHFGPHYTVEQATIFTLPDELPPIIVSGFGEHSTELAGEIGDGFFNVAPDADSTALFRRSGGEGKPCYGKIDVALADSVAAARRLAHETWPTSGLSGELSQVLPLPAHFEAAVSTVSQDDVAQKILCEQDPQAHIERFEEYRRAGFDHVTVQQVGLEQDRLLDLYGAEVLPALRAGAAGSRPA
jgi:G6PDH family F420-dependent oxidoreductase